MIKIFLEKLLNLIYTKRCCICSDTSENSFLCSKCRKKIFFHSPSVYKTIQGCPVYVCSVYDGAAKKLILDFKYNRKRYLAESFASIMFEYFEKLNIKNSNFIVLSVPVHKKRLRERHYNHMDLAADEFSKLTGLKADKKFLLRLKDTEKQYKLSRSERIKNLEGAFALNKLEHIDKNADILIIDDIISTGATLGEIIKLLKKEGCKNITAITLAAPELKNSNAVIKH